MKGGMYAEGKNNLVMVTMQGKQRYMPIVK